MALTRNIINSVIDDAGLVPSGVTITEPTLSGTGVTTRSPEQTYTIATSGVRNASASTGYTALETSLGTAVNTYLETFYDTTENVTFDIIITDIKVVNTAATIFNTGTENYEVSVIIKEKHD